MSEVRELPPSVTQIKKDLLDPRAISKKYDPQGRSATAAAIVQTRQEGRSISGQIDAKSAANTQAHVDYDSFSQLAKEKDIEAYARQKSLLVRLKARLGFGDKKLQETQAERDSLYKQSYGASEQASHTSQEIEELSRNQEAMPNPKDMLAAYYEKMQTTPLTQQEKREFLKPEILESLTTEEYIALWKRLNPYFLSHVTRQGFRDHNTMEYHSGGMEEFHAGFAGVLADELKIRPPLAIRSLPRRDEESVRKYLESWALQGENEEQAKFRFQNMLNFSLASAPNYPDKTAVHFMAQTVGDRYYGGETDNEVFFVFPTDTIASQHDYGFNGNEKDFTKMQSESKWNDVFVWPTDLNDPGISINDGLTFLPGNTPVDPETGSKYASKVEVVDGREKRVMIEDQDKVKTFIDWVVKQDEQSPIRTAAKAYYEARDSSFVGLKDDLARVLFTVASEQMQQLGFTPDAATSLALSYWKDVSGRGSREMTEETAKTILYSSGAQWKRAENPVPSKQYWENYFSSNPNQKPQHIVYYEGDAHNAVLDFQQKNGIGAADTSDKEGKLLGFDDHFVAKMKEDPRANRGYAELVAVGNKIIEEHFGGQRAA